MLPAAVAPTLSSCKMTTSELKVAECGAATAFAPSLSESFAALSRRDTALFRNETFFDRAYQPQLCAFREDIGIGSFEERLEALAVEALQDLNSRRLAKKTSGIALDVDLMIVLPEEAEAEGLGRERLEKLGRELSDLAEKQLLESSDLNVQSAQLFCGGNSGVGFILDHLRRSHAPDRAPGSLILALDSYSDRQRLTACNDNGRLYSKANRYGFIPGEAGCALLVTSRTPTTHSLGDVWLTGTATALEKVKQFEEAESAFPALSDCCFEAVEQSGSSSHDLRISAWLADWDNSRYRASELSLALHRLGPDHAADGLEPTYPAIDFGNVGAAFGALASALVFERVQESVLMNPTEALGAGVKNLISAGSTFSGLRSAIVLEAVEPAKEEA